MDIGEKLCLACGLCCDGSLFDNVRLKADESAAALKELGLPIRRSRAKIPVAFLRQPCAALCSDRSCRVYRQRPEQCRSFECQVFRKLTSGRIGFEGALRTVRQFQRKARKARHLLRQLGEDDEKSSLSKRFRRVQRRVEAGDIGVEAGELFADLGLIMHQLDLMAHAKFYTSEVD